MLGWIGNSIGATKDRLVSYVAHGKIQQDMDTNREENEIFYSPEPLIDGIIEGGDGLTDLLVGLFPFLLIIGILGLVFTLTKISGGRN